MLSQFAHELRCLYCGKPNPATEWRTAGDLVPFYYQREPGKYNLTMTCPHCDRAWYVVWDDNPGALVRLPFPDTSGPAADGSPTDPDMEGFVNELLSDKAEVRNQAIERARKLAQNGDSTGLQALAEAIRRRSGKPRCQFHTPGIRVSNLAELSAARDELRGLASKRQLLNDPKRTQSLLAQIPSADFHELWAEVGRLGGEQEWLAFQLLGTHVIVHAELLNWHRKHGDEASRRRSVEVKPVPEAKSTVLGGEWYYKTSQAELGPMSPSTLRKLAADGALQPDDLVRKGSDANWVKASLVKGLFPAKATPTSKAASSPAAAAMDQWYCKSSDTELGPLSPRALRELAATGVLEPEDLVKKGAGGKWVKASLVKGLFPATATPTSKAAPPGNPPRQVKRSGARTPARAQSPETTGWFHKVGDICLGPFSLADLAQMIARGALDEGDSLRRGRSGVWTPAKDLVELRDHWRSRAQQKPAQGQPPRKERGPVEVGSGLPAGATVPKAGKYRCEFCGQGGMADLMNQSIAELLGMTGDSLSTGLSEHARKQTIKFFQKGARFTKCPNCGPATGWILEDDVR